MHGVRGTRARRRVILVEFLLGALGGIALGVWSVVIAATPPWLTFGVWIIGIGSNYVPLAWYAIGFSRAGALEAELQNVDVPAELRHFTVAQLWIAVPFLFVALVARRHVPTHTG